VNTRLPGGGCGLWETSLPISFLVKVTYTDNWLTGQTVGLSFDAPDQSQLYVVKYLM